MAVTWAEGMFNTMSEPPSTEQLFDQVVGNCTGLISRIALSFETDAALRRELIQDILLAVWIALPSFRGDSSLKTFVASIAQKRSISHVGRRTREPKQVELSVELPSSSPPPDEIAVLNDIKQQLVASIQLLPVPQREAIMLSLEGFSHGEIAEVLGISVNAAMLRCQRAKNALKAMLDRS